MELDNLTETQRNDPKTIGRKGLTENLTFEQRRELMAIIKRMIPPIPSRGIIDIRFSFWFFKNWYIVFIFGRDTRKQFKALDQGDADRKLTTIARIFTYIFMFIMLFMLIMLLLYMIKSMANIDIFPEEHLKDIIKEYLGRR